MLLCYREPALCPESTPNRFVYDAEDDAWATASPLPYAVAGLRSSPQLNSNGEIVIVVDDNSAFRLDRQTSQWVTDGGLRIEHAPTGDPRALLLG